MKASLWALILSALLGATVKAQQPSFPLLTNVLNPTQRENVRTKAEKGNPAAQCVLGLEYQYGDGVPQDYAEAVKWYRMAAEQGDAQGQYLLGSYYGAGIGVAQDYAEAVKWCRKAADQDDPRNFQISVPVQPGNSGGALVDERGNVIGVVVAKLNAATALDTSGALPENVNYAVKSSFLLGFLESVPEVAAKVKDPGVKEQKFEVVVKSVEDATVLVLVY